MDTFWLVLVQWLHVLSGIVWVGGSVFMAVVLWPVLLRQPAPEARALFASFVRPIGVVMGISGQGVLWLGLLRGIAFGPVRSLDVLLGTAYGRTFGVALLLTLAVVAIGIATGRTLEARLWDGDAWRPGAARTLLRGNAVTLTLLAGVVACMVLMRFGL